MPVIIDGHNLLHSIQKITEEGRSISDVGLCRIIGKYLQVIGEKGEIVFDGKGPPEKFGFENIRNLEVIFVGMFTDADTVIEDKIRASTAPKRLVIVSSDRRVLRAARARRAKGVKCEAFWKDLQKQLSRKRASKEPEQKRRGLTEGETKQWLEFFGLEQ